MPTPLVELYRDPVIHDEASTYTDIWRRDGTVEESLKRAGVLATINTEAALIEHVEALPEFDSSLSRHRAASLLGCLPVSVLLDNFGEEVTAWTLANDDSYRSGKLREALQDKGYDSDLLEKARMLAWEERQPPRGRDVVKQYEVMTAVLDGIHETVDLPGLLQASASDGAVLSEKRLQDYALVPLRAEAGNVRAGGRVYEWGGHEAVRKPGVHYSVWLDTPVGLTVTYKRIPQALLGIAAGGGIKALEIRQLQRVFGKTYDPADPRGRFNGLKPPRGLMPLDWQKLLVGVAAGLAAVIGKDEVGIRAGNKIPSHDCRINLEQAVAAYDRPAERLGFQRNEDGDWRMKIGQLITLFGN